MSDEKAKDLVESQMRKQVHTSFGDKSERDRVAKKIIRRYALACSSIGAASAVPGVLPGIGTAVSAVAAAPDIVTCMKLQVDMCKCLAVIYDYDISEEDAKLLYRMVAMTGSINSAIRRGTTQVGTKAGVRLLRSHLKGAALKAVKEAFKKAGVVFTRKAAEKAIPLGIGVGVSGIANWSMTVFVGRNARRFFEIESRDG